MEEEKNAFYVVRKGDVIGIYKSFSECQAQSGSSVCDPSVSVFKGYGLPKEAENFLTSHGLKNAAYAIHASDVQNDLFGKLVPCRFQEPAKSSGKALANDSPPKRSLQVLESAEMTRLSSFPSHPPKKCLRSEDGPETRPSSSGRSSCTLEFDGASKGNPGPAGAGAILRADDGSLVCKLREGVGIATNNAAEYRAIILGLKHALREGFKNIRVQGDSNLVCKQIEGLWKIKNLNLVGLCKEAQDLKDKFISFEIKHVFREFNTEADAQANLAIKLKDGEVEADCKK